MGFNYFLINNLSNIKMEEKCHHKTRCHIPQKKKLGVTSIMI